MIVNAILVFMVKIVTIIEWQNTGLTGGKAEGVGGWVMCAEDGLSNLTM